jgi:catalase
MMQRVKPSGSDPVGQAAKRGMERDHMTSSTSLLYRGNWAGPLFRPLNSGQLRRLFDNLAFTMEGAPQFIVDRRLEYFVGADPDYGRRMREALANR